MKNYGIEMVNWHGKSFMMKKEIDMELKNHLMSGEI